MATLCILTVEEQSLWNKVVSSLLQTQENESTVIVKNVGSMSELITEIDRNNVDLILFRDSNPLADEKSLVHLMTIYPRLRIVVASELSNWLRVFKKDEIQLTSFTDLVHLLNPK